MSRPMVSVLVPSYQHAQYIAKCLDGILMQRTTFPFEVLVGEDESTDGTREICQRYAAEYPDRIRLFLRSRKDVMVINGRPTGRANLLHLLGEARGRYIALCEGDDYWIDPDKLQRQVDALEADPKAVGVFTNAYNETNGERTPYLDGATKSIPGMRVTQRDLFQPQGIPTCTVVFRSDRWKECLPVLRRAPVGDTILFTQLTRSWYLSYQPEFTAVRTMHAGGMMSQKGEVHRIRTSLLTIPFLQELSLPENKAILHERYKQLLLRGWQRSQDVGDRELARLAWTGLLHHRRWAGWNTTTTIRNFFKAYLPVVDRTFARLRGEAVRKAK